MNKIIKFFLIKERLNYTLFIFLLLFGIISYQSIPKDVFPVLQVDQVTVEGSYEGSSVDILDKMVVMKLEKNFKSVTGVEKIVSYIKNGTFSIMLTLSQGSDKVKVLNKVKDVISNSKSDFPSGMDDPTASAVDWSSPLVNITISSKIFPKEMLIEIADNVKTTISSISNISKVVLNESTTKNFEIILDSKKIELYNLNKSLLYNEIKQLSYIYPLGKIEDQKEHLFLSTTNGKKEVEEYLNTLIKIENKIFYLSDIARVESNYKQTDIISKLNGEVNIDIGIFKNEKANAIALVEKIKEKVKLLDKEYKDVNIGIFSDTSVYIKNRLNTVISGIMFGLILVTVALYLLINKRVAFIVVMGIPTAILLGVGLLSLTSYSINMISLIGALLILGVLVDDAVIIAENIQRHISKGEDKLQAVIDGTKEVLTPVLASSITTIFAFLPMLLITGEIGELLKLIPIVVIILIITSLLESFVFLPLHAKHLLDKNDKELDWSKAQTFYLNILHKIIAHRKIFLFIFVVTIPIITVLTINALRYQFFPDFDSDKIFINGKFDINHTLEDTYSEAKIIEDVLLKYKNELALKSITFTTGERQDSEDNNEQKQSVFQLNMELHDRKPSNFVDAYITPTLSFNSNDVPKIRTMSVNETVLKIKELLKNKKPINLLEFSIKKEGAGIISNDIEILLNAKNKELLLTSIMKIKEKLTNLPGVIFVDDTAKFGTKELKLKINSYGESLGFNESTLASSLSPLFLKSEQSKGLDLAGVFEIITYDEYKNDLSRLRNLEINIPNSDQKIAIDEICNFMYERNFDSITKVNTINTKRIVANVNSEILTSNEALTLLEPIIKEIQNEGVIIQFEGEDSENKRMFNELSYAFFIAIFLIFITLLILFDSFKMALIVLSIIPFSVLGALIGHIIMGSNLTLPSFIGMLGLAGVVINDAIVMLDFIKKSKTLEEMMERAKLRLRPIIITSITTFLGLSTLIFYATGQSKILQPIAISLGFGLIWGTILTLIYLPALFAVVKKMRKE